MFCLIWGWFGEVSGINCTVDEEVEAHRDSVAWLMSHKEGERAGV